MRTKKFKSHLGILLLIVVPALVMTSCNEPPVSFLAENNHEIVSTEFQRMRAQAANLAKVLAADLNQNELHRKEVFSKIANKFDGDVDILFTSLYDRTLKDIREFSLQRSKESGLISEIDLNQIKNDIPKLELMMPKLKNWTDRKISESGGLVVAYYPFGVADRHIKELVGFDKTGKEVIITKESSDKIPYIIIRSNERTDDSGNLLWKLYEPNLKMGIQAQSLHGIDPKFYNVTSRTDWKDVNLMELAEIQGLEKLQVCYEDCGGGGGGGGGGGVPGPGLSVGWFWTGDINYIEGWLESDAEIFIRVKQYYSSITIEGVAYPVFEQLFITTSIYNYDLDGGYWGSWDYRRPWSERQLYVIINGQYYYNDYFHLEVWDQDNWEWSSEKISEGDFNRITFSQWGSDWYIGPGPVKVRIFEYQ